jgi:uncharacterized protein HemX
MLSHVKHERQQAMRPWSRAVPRLGLAMVALAVAFSPAAAQDVRGMQICTVEKQMERRTSCLQANVEFLQQALFKLSREMQAKIESEDRALAAAHAEIESLKSAVKKLQAEVAKLQAKSNPASKK